MPKAPPPVPGLFLAKTPDDPAAQAQADDVRDIVAAEVQGRMPDPSPTQAQLEEERAAEARFFEVVARHLDSALTWADGKCRVTELGSRDGYHLQIRDREGRPYEAQVYYSELVEVAQVERAHDLALGPERMAQLIAQKLEAARKRYFERMLAT